LLSAYGFVRYSLWESTGADERGILSREDDASLNLLRNCDLLDILFGTQQSLYKGCSMGDPLPALMKTLREAHGMSQLDVAMCMGIAEDTYRHIEKGRRPLPDIRQGEFARWMAAFLDCVRATDEERKHVTELTSRMILEELSRLLIKRPPDP
jgi:DNA-binding XRE family transcriptional regulator